jgi:uncharacterized membrane protein (DUF2068 family)
MNSSPESSRSPVEPSPAGAGSGAEETTIIPKQRAPTLMGIALFKLGKGVVFLLISIALYCLSDDNITEEFRQLVHWLKLSPETKLVAVILKKLGTITESNMLVVAAGTVSYAALALVEGIGLWMRFSWAAYLAIAESAIFIPYEVHELSRKLTVGMFSLLCVNLLIVIYLWRNRHRLFRHHHHHHAPKA